MHALYRLGGEMAHVATAFVAAYHVFSQDPIPEKSSVLRYVQLDAWNPERPWDDEDPWNG